MGAIPSYPLVGVDSGQLVALRGSTPLEGPQILWTWDALPLETEAVRLRTKARHPPEREDDGELLFESYAPGGAHHVADLTVMPYRVYHAALFVRVGGLWFIAENGTAWAWSGEAPHLEETPLVVVLATGSAVGSYATQAKLTSTEGIARGDWLLLGRAQTLVVRVLDVLAGGWVRFERIGAFSEPRCAPIRGVRLSFVTGTGIVRRLTGSWVDAGLRAGQRVRVRNAADATGANGATSVVSVSDSELRLDATFSADETTWFATIEEEPGLVAGEPVVRLAQTATRMQRRLYEFLPKHWRDRDSESGQGVILSPTQLDDGSMANLGAPGLQHPQQTSLRVLGAALGRAYSGTDPAAMGLLLDLHDTPADFARRFASRYGYVPPSDADDADTRALVLQQPHYVRRKGRFDFLVALVKAITGQTPRAVFGRARVARFNAPPGGGGLPSTWLGLASNVGVNELEDITAAWPVNALAGWRVRPKADVATSFGILSNDASNLFTDPADGDMESVVVHYGPLASDAATLRYGFVLGMAAFQITLSASTGLLVNSWFRISGCTAEPTQNNIYQVASISGANVTVVNHGQPDFTDNEANAIIEGGVLEQLLSYAGGSALVANELIGYYLVPKTTDTGGPGGTPRAVRVTGNGARRIDATGPAMNGWAAPGDTFRVMPQYMLIPPTGGADPRVSLYTPRPDSLFHDRGVTLYVADDLSDSAKRELDHRLPELIGSTTSFQLRADGGDGSLDILLLEVN